MATNRVAFTPDPALRGAEQAISLARSIIKTARVGRWSDLGGVIPARVALHPGQLALLRSHLRLISYLTGTHTSDDGTKTKATTFAFCTECSKWLLMPTTPAPPRTCPLTLKCSGELRKVPAAPRSELPAAEDGLP